MDHLPYVVLVQDNCDTKRERTSAIRFATRKAADEAVEWIGSHDGSGAYVIEDDPAVIAAVRAEARAARLAAITRAMNSDPRANVPLSERPAKSVMDVLTEARAMVERNNKVGPFNALIWSQSGVAGSDSLAFKAFAEAAGTPIGHITDWEENADVDDIIDAFSLAIARENPHKPRPNV